MAVRAAVNRMVGGSSPPGGANTTSPRGNQRGCVQSENPELTLQTPGAFYVGYSIMLLMEVASPETNVG